MILPLTMVGTILGRNLAGTPDAPCRVNAVPRPIPEKKWFMEPLVIIMLGGILPFGSIFIEMYALYILVPQIGRVSFGHSAIGHNHLYQWCLYINGIQLDQLINQRPSFHEQSITGQYTLCPIDIHSLNYLSDHSLAHTLTLSYNPFRYFIFTSFWAYKIYYVYGFMLLVFVILMIVTVCVTIVCTYFLLNAEDYRW